MLAGQLSPIEVQQGVNYKSGPIKCDTDISILLHLKILPNFFKKAFKNPIMSNKNSNLQQSPKQFPDPVGLGHNTTVVLLKKKKYCLIVSRVSYSSLPNPSLTESCTQQLHTYSSLQDGAKRACG